MDYYMPLKFFSFVFCVLAAVLLIYVVAPPPAKALVISEVYPNPDSSRDATEWLEIYNDSEEGEELSEWQLNGVTLPYMAIAPTEIILLTKDKTEFVKAYPELDMGKVKIGDLPVSLVNSGLELALTFDSEGKNTKSFTVNYGQTLTNQSWVLQGASCNSLTLKDLHSINQFTPDIDCADSKSEPQLVMQEIMVNPLQGPEWIEFKNVSGKKLSLEIKQIDIFANDKEVGDFGFWDADLNQVTYDAELEVAAGGLGIIAFKQDKDNFKDCSSPSTCKVLVELRLDELVVSSLQYDDSVAGYTNGIEQGILKTSLVPTPYRKNKLAGSNDYSKIRISAIYPSPNEGEEEWLELKNDSGNTVQLWGWTVADESKAFVFSDQLLLAKSALKLQPKPVTLNNSGDSLVLKDFAGKEISSLSYSSSEKGVVITDEYVELSISTTQNLTADATAEISVPQATESLAGNAAIPEYDLLLPQLSTVDFFESSSIVKAVEGQDESVLGLEVQSQMLLGVLYQAITMALLGLVCAIELFVPVKSGLVSLWSWWNSAPQPQPKSMLA